MNGMVWLQRFYFAYDSENNYVGGDRDDGGDTSMSTDGSELDCCDLCVLGRALWAPLCCYCISWMKIVVNVM